MKYQIFMILGIILLIDNIKSVSKSKEKVDKFCDKDSLDTIHWGEEDLNDLRDSWDNEFYNNYRDIIEYLKDPSDNSE